MTLEEKVEEIEKRMELLEKKLDFDYGGYEGIRIYWPYYIITSTPLPRPGETWCNGTGGCHAS
jgi:hypothetical protein